MPSSSHEILVDLLRAAPGVVGLLLGPRVVASDMPFTDVSADLGTAAPVEYRADLVFQSPELVVIPEVQHSRDANKPWVWPGYVGQARARYRRPVILMVVTMRRSIARWARKTIRTGHPGFDLTPVVFGPDDVPRVLDPEVARTWPELAVLSALAHGGEADGPGIARAGLAAARTLDEDRAQLYTDIILASLSAAARAILEAEMTAEHGYYSTTFRKHFRKGERQGRKEGLTLATCDDILAVLEARGLAVDDASRERILSEQDLPTLRAWLRRAATVESAPLVFGEGAASTNQAARRRG